MSVRKYLIYLWIGALLVLSYLWIQRPSLSEETNAANVNLEGYVITIDPGHGGFDNGANVGKTKEDELNLKISEALKIELESRGASVYLTRTEDMDMTQRNHHYSKQDDMYLRGMKIDENNPDVFVSIHLNASSSSRAWGSQVFYYKNSEQGKILANMVHENMKKVTGTRKKIQSADFYVLRSTKTTGVLIECGFISNANERGQLKSSKYHAKLASAIADGLEAYLLQYPKE